MKWDAEFLSNKLTREDRENVVRAFRGTDGYSFSLLEVTKEYNINQTMTRTSIKDTFLIPSEENQKDNFIIFVADSRWKNGSMRFAHVFRDQKDKIVSVKMAALPSDSSVIFKMETETSEEIEEIATAYEESIARLQNQHPDEPVEDVLLEETTKEVPQQSRRPLRKGKRSNKFAVEIV